MEGVLEGGRVVTDDERVDVELERHARVAELFHAVERSKYRVRPIWKRPWVAI